MSSKVTRRSLLGATLVSAISIGCRQKATAFPGYALVVTGLSRELAVVDLAAFALSGKIAFPEPVSQVLYRAQGPVVYALSGPAGQLHEFNWTERKVTRTISVGEHARSMRFDHEQKCLWISVEAPASMVCVPVEGFRVAQRVALDRPAANFDLSPYFPHLAASLDGGGLAMVADTATPVVKLLREQETFGPMRFRSDGRQVIAANHSGNSLSFVRASDQASLVDLPIAMRARELCFTPDGGQLFVTDGERDGITIVYPYSTEVDRSVLAGKSPGAMYACENPPYLLAANRLSSDITVLDVVSGKLVAIVPVGNAPGFLAVTPDQQYVLALNEGSGDMAVIRLANVRSLRNKTAPLFTMVPVGESPRSLVVIPA